MKSTILVLSALLIFTACNDGGGGTAPAVSAPMLASPVIAPPVTADPVAVVDPTPSPTPGPSPSPTPVAVTLSVYSVTKTMAPQSNYSFIKVTFTGSCAIYLTKTYCWDDGIKTVMYFGSPFYYSFWGVGAANGVANSTTCWGSCVNDTMAQPTEVTADQAVLMQVFEYETGVTVSNVFSTGVQSQVDCQETGSTLTCGSLVVNL